MDAFTREQIQELILEIWHRTGKMAFFITHDVEEAVVLASQVVVLHPRPGRIGAVRSINLPYPRDPLSPEVAEEVRRLRISLSAASARCS